MSDNEPQSIKVRIEDLRVGHFVDLECSWMDHPFVFSKFLIQSPAEIAAIRAMGRTEVTVLPGRSKTVEAAPAAAPAAVPTEGTRQEMQNRKQAMMDRASDFRDARQQAAAKYQETIRKLTTFSREVRTAPANAVQTAGDIVGGMVEDFARDSNVLVNLVNLSGEGFSLNNHALNVAVLSLFLGRYMQLKPGELTALGIGALIHDIGKIEIPSQIIYKRQPLNAAEEGLMRTHATIGSRLAQKIGGLPAEAVAIIEQHHELMDGSGYPRGVQGRWISMMPRIVAIANIYDNLCNPSDPAKGLTPRDAMAQLFQVYAGKLDKDLVSAFIKVMGVYPPGTVVQLNDENIGLVVSVDPNYLLKPRVILYNPDIPREQALMVDLLDRPDLEIKAALKPSEFPPRVVEYLGMPERLGYFYQALKGSAS